jgi:hypothetical protein
MRKLAATIGLTTLVATIFAIVTPAAAFAAGGTTTCNGELAPGTYGHVVVPEGGLCTSAGPVTITHGVVVERAGTLELGSDENPAHAATISGGVVATDADGVHIHHSTINGGLRIHGGQGPFGGPFQVTWNAIEDNIIHGGAVIDGYIGFWQGFLNNNVRGTVNLNNNNLFEKDDANEFVSNTIYGNMNCFNNDPAPQVGDSEGGPNTVTGHKNGQCADL